MPKIIDHDKRREEIVEVATRLILKGGFEAATMRSIAAEAGFANGALKHYFPGKESIIAAMFENTLAALEQAAQAHEGTVDAGKQLYDYLLGPIPRDDEQIAAGRILLALWDHAMTDDELGEVYRGHLRRWREILDGRLHAAYAAGVITMAPPYDAVTREYISVIIGGAVVDLMYPAGDRIDDYVGYVDAFADRLGLARTPA